MGGGSMAEETRLFDVPAPARATPFTELSTNDGFRAQASPIGGEPGPTHAPESPLNTVDEPFSMLSELRSGSDGISSESISASQVDESQDVSSVREPDTDNPFDASAPTGETKRPIIVKKPFGWPESSHKNNGNQSRLPFGLMGRITALILLALTVYLGFYALPYLFEDSKKPAALLRIETVPPGAQVFIDSRLSEQKTNANIMLPPRSTVSITVKLSGYEVEEFEVDAGEALKQSGGEPIQKKLKLIPLD